jgi:manganese-dependent inorganic pyrophosphatase
MARHQPQPLCELRVIRRGSGTQVTERPITIYAGGAVFAPQQQVMGMNDANSYILAEKSEGMHKLLVTSYLNPDLDGIACMRAYAEYLQIKGQHAIPAFFGTPQRDAEYVIKEFSIGGLLQGHAHLASQIILVDASDASRLPPEIHPDHVIEVIDHRKINDAHIFPTAKVEIELVGACATIIAEKFMQEKLTISTESAMLLYAAIISNTIEFKAKITTTRDKKAATWLRDQVDIPLHFTHDLFAYKSDIGATLKEVLKNDMKLVKYHDGTNVGIAQLEIVESEKLVNERLQEIEEVLLVEAKEKSLDIVFLTCVDVMEECNTFVAVDEISRKLLEETLGITFSGKTARRKGILMRKEIAPMLREKIEKTAKA